MASHATTYVRRGHQLLWMLAILVFVAACRQKQLPKGIRELRIPEPQGYFVREGYVRMVPPLLLPRRTPRNEVEVWLHLPDGARITTNVRDGRSLLKLPAGSSAARVESIARRRDKSDWEWSIADVRGTRFQAGKELFFVLRPEAQRPQSPLVGWEWERSSAAQNAAATDLVAELAASIVAKGRQDQERRGARRANACASCHQYARPENELPSQHGIANRATDDSGCFQVQNVLISQLPLETYFPIEVNRASPFIKFGCPAGGELQLPEAGRPTCSNGAVPWGRFDVASAIAAADEQAEGLCAARRYLFEHLDAIGRQAFREGFAECSISIPDVTAEPAAP